MRPRKTLAAGLGIAILTLLGSISVAHAQYGPPPQGYPPPPYYPPPPPPPPPHGVYRSGLVYGFSLGAGGLSISDCGDVCGAVGMAEFHLGGMIGPRLALMGDFWESIRYFSDANLGNGETFNGIYTLAAQYWLTDQLWVKGGVGFGRLEIDSDDEGIAIDDESGFAFMLAGGIEIVQSYNFALDLQLRYGNVAYSSEANGGAGDANTFGFMVGFNWY
jgi:hypothetical protein